MYETNFLLTLCYVFSFSMALMEQEILQISQECFLLHLPCPARVSSRTEFSDVVRKG